MAKSPDKKPNRVKDFFTDIDKKTDILVERQHLKLALRKEGIEF